MKLSISLDVLRTMVMEMPWKKMLKLSYFRGALDRGSSASHVNFKNPSVALFTIMCVDKFGQILESGCHIIQFSLLLVGSCRPLLLQISSQNCLKCALGF